MQNCELLLTMNAFSEFDDVLTEMSIIIWLKIWWAKMSVFSSNANSIRFKWSFQPQNGPFIVLMHFGER